VPAAVEASPAVNVLFEALVEYDGHHRPRVRAAELALQRRSA
jgi:hypothetical protein